ncbi:hypothetical protein HMPREF2888_01470 [Corynebacterium sp. HMSC077D03]|uniref:Uncharacterized protein n=1 Tax=Corynebacterium simulans TaxID=146827 RepID=A0ABR5VAV9_9CORY|nr:hypothetical protein WM41_0845 [Corynebacterium simulans]OFQ43708.1 hypothetical protein HMPREF2935_08455 [Corynebacterium sp. HMSC076D02]OFR40265.1 hypothetical protein HMPREF2888_01470 [Corynebacterium sp. HMSC077D03]
MLLFCLLHLKVIPPAQLDSLHELISMKSWWNSVDSLAKVAGSALSEADDSNDFSAEDYEVDECWGVVGEEEQK